MQEVLTDPGLWVEIVEDGADGRVIGRWRWADAVPSVGHEIEHDGAMLTVARVRWSTDEPGTVTVYTRRD